MTQSSSPTRSAPIRDVVVLGAGPTGLTTALLLAGAGLTVEVLDRDGAEPARSADSLGLDDEVDSTGSIDSTNSVDEVDAAERAWTDWSRPGVNQFHQVHIALPRWHHLMRAELPSVSAALRDLGGVEVNLLHSHHPPYLTGGWHTGDERYATLTARRPVLEAAIAAVAESHPGVTVRRGMRVAGLVTTGPGDRRVVGVRTPSATIAADLVVDASGHRTPVARWLAASGAGPVEVRTSDGLTYYTRHYRAGGGPPFGTGGVLTHHPSYSVLRLPADHGCWGLAIIVSSRDRATRSLRDERCWEAAVRASGGDERWLAGQPITGIQPMAGLSDVVRDYAPGGVPVATGVVAVGDAWATTSPFLGRGLSLGALQAVALRDAVAEEGSTSAEAVGARYATLLRDRVLPYVQATVGFGRHRVAELAAEAAGQPYRTDDPAWAGSLALAAGARADPVLLRAHTTIASLLALPTEVFADVEVRARVGPFFGSPPYPAERPGRIELLAALETPSAVFAVQPFVTQRVPTQQGVPS